MLLSLYSVCQLEEFLEKEESMKQIDALLEGKTTQIVENGEIVDVTDVHTAAKILSLRALLENGIDKEYSTSAVYSSHRRGKVQVVKSPSNNVNYYVITSIKKMLIDPRVPGKPAQTSQEKFKPAYKGYSKEVKEEAFRFFAGAKLSEEERTHLAEYRQAKENGITRLGHKMSNRAIADWLSYKFQLKVNQQTVNNWREAWKREHPV